jgi:hypothetical protein
VPGPSANPHRQPKYPDKYRKTRAKIGEVKTSTWFRKFCAVHHDQVSADWLMICRLHPLGLRTSEKFESDCLRSLRDYLVYVQKLPVSHRDIMPVAIDQFDERGQDGIAVVNQYGRAIRGWRCRAQSAFEHFPSLWMAFNRWGLCVTLEHSDSMMIGALARDAILANHFDDLKQQNRTFRRWTKSFAEMWPVFRDSDIILGDAADVATNLRAPMHRRQTVLDFKLRGFRYSPTSARGDVPIDTQVLGPYRATWANTLWTIYQVRSNFAHGGKAPHIESDVVLVNLTYKILLTYLGRIPPFESIWRLRQ